MVLQTVEVRWIFQAEDGDPKVVEPCSIDRSARECQSKV
jgi:hypothetical protein